MFAKVLFVCGILATAHAGGYGGIGIGSAYMSSGAPALIADVGHSTTSSQSTVINHIAPAVSKIAVAATDLGHSGILSRGLISGGLLGGIGTTANYGGAVSNGILGAPLMGKAVMAAPATISSQSAVIKHIAPAAAPVVVAAEPIGHSGILPGGMITGGLLGGIGNMAMGYGGIGNMAMGYGGIGNMEMGYGGIGNVATGYGTSMSNGLVGSPMVGKTLISAPAAVSSQSTVIKHIAPASVTTAMATAPMGHTGFLSAGLFGGLGNNALNYGGLAGNGMLASTGSSYLAPVAITAPVAIAAPVATKYAIAAPPTVTTQTTVVSRAAPKIALAPITLSTGIIGNEMLGGGYGLGNGIASTPLSLTKGLLGGYYGGSLGMAAGKMY